MFLGLVSKYFNFSSQEKGKIKGFIRTKLNNCGSRGKLQPAIKKTSERENPSRPIIRKPKATEELPGNFGQAAKIPARNSKAAVKKTGRKKQLSKEIISKCKATEELPKTQAGPGAQKPAPKKSKKAMPKLKKASTGTEESGMKEPEETPKRQKTVKVTRELANLIKDSINRMKK